MFHSPPRATVRAPLPTVPTQPTSLVRNGRRLLATLLTVSAALVLLTPVAKANQRIYEGKPAGQCGLPNVAMLEVDGTCTATLVHPRVLLFAEHCGDTPKILFGEEFNDGLKEVIPERCEKFPYPNGFNNPQDFAYCLLKEPLDLPITPIIMRSCIEDLDGMIARGDAELVVAGFGMNENQFVGRKHWGTTGLRDLDWDRGLLIAGYGGPENNSSACSGDSGGPTFVRMKDGTYWGLGIFSTAVEPFCTLQDNENESALMENAAKWVEERTGLDITPCFNDAGEWEPTSECTNVYSGRPEGGSGDWDNWCEGTAAVAAPTTCGAAGDVDMSPTTVSIVEPADGSTVTAAGQQEAQLTIRAEAQDADGIKELSLSVNGAAVMPPVTAPPYEWQQALAPGEYALQVTAMDETGKSTDSSLVNITVEAGPADSVPPTVVVTAPTAGTQFDLSPTETTAAVQINVDATDEDSGVASVELQLNSMSLGSVETPPYSWMESLEAGEYSVVATATDVAGNTVSSEPTMFTVAAAGAGPNPMGEPSATPGGEQSPPGTAGMPAGPNLVSEVEDDGGCGCRIPRGRPMGPSPASAWLVAACGAWLMRRRRAVRG